MTTIELMQSKKLKVQNVRAKLRSMRNLDKADEDTLLVLEKSLQKHNKIDDPQVFTGQFDNKNEDDFIIENKLWNYFKNQSQKYCDKVQREKVNAWHKITKQILQKIENKVNSNQNHIQQMQNLIKNKYKQIHQLYKQIQTVKLQKYREKGLKTRRGNPQSRGNVQTSRGQKINMLYNNIQSLKQQIQERNQQNQKIKVDLKRLKAERISFLVNFIKAGYYLEDGIKYFLQKMIQINYKPDISIFPQFLDTRSKEYLMEQYEYLSKKIQENKKQAERSHQLKLRVKSTSNMQLGSLAKQQHFKDIYSGTKDYLLKLLLKQQWKKKQAKLPKIGFKNQDDEAEKKQEAQRKRVKLAYTEQLREKVKKVQFGIKLDTILP